MNIFDPRVSEPALNQRLLLRSISGDWSRGRYIGNDLVCLDTEMCDDVSIFGFVQYLEEPSLYQDFDKIPRLRRGMTITEKIDGQNVSAVVPRNAGDIRVGIRNGYIDRKTDTTGFADFVYRNTDQFRELGAGRHFGEWWGPGIGKRKYPVPDRRFSMFNTGRWALADDAENAAAPKPKRILPPCCGLVPVLYQGVFDTAKIDEVVEYLRRNGSRVVPGFARPEGVVVYHEAADQYFKRTLDKDDVPKSLAEI